MPLVSKGYSPNAGVALERDWELFCSNLDLLLSNEQIILNHADYFFVAPACCFSSFPYISGDGQLFLGYLLLGWQADILTEQCPDCKAAKVSITYFGGFPLSGRNSWTGISLCCRQRQQGKDSIKFRQWMDLVLKLRQAFPDKVSEEQEYDSQKFTWGGNGLTPVMKKKTIWKPVADPVTLAVLIDELKAGHIRKGRPINVHLLKKDLKLKFSSN
jgi:hypothetical protein